MSKLFGPHDTLILYSFTYGPERELPCPGCTHLLDGLDGAARQPASCILPRLEMSFWDTLQEIAEKEGMSLAKFRTTNRSGTDHQ